MSAPSEPKTGDRGGGSLRTVQSRSRLHADSIDTCRPLKSAAGKHTSGHRRPEFLRQNR